MCVEDLKSPKSKIGAGSCRIIEARSACDHLLGGGRYIEQSDRSGGRYTASHGLQGGVEWYGAVGNAYSQKNSCSTMWSVIDIQRGEV